MLIINPLASPSVGAPALKYEDVNTEASPSKAKGLIELNLSNFITDNVTDMRFMFYRCSSLIELNLSNFNTNNATYYDYMFYGCSDELKKKILKQNKII